MFYHPAQFPRPRYGRTLLAAVPLVLGLTFCPTLAAASELRQSPIVKAVAARSAVGGEHSRRKDGRSRRRHGDRRRARPSRQRHGHGRGHRSPRLHPYQLPRGRRRPRDPGHAVRRKPLRGHAGRPRPGDRPGRHQDRAARQAAGDRRRHLVRPHGGRIGDRRGQRLRVREYGHPRHHQRVAPGGSGQRRPILRRPDPDRRQHQPGQLRRPAVEHRRRDDRHQRGGPRRGPRHRLRHSRR